MVQKDTLFFIAGCLLFVGIIAGFICRMPLRKILFWGAIYCYTVAVFGITLFPIPYQAAPHMDSVPHNFIPLKTIISTLSNGLTRTAAIQIGGNILIAAPYGIFLSLVTRKKRLWKLLLLAMLFPFVIETLQLTVGLVIGSFYRSFDVDDFLLNFLGVCLGIMAANLLPKTFKEKLKNCK